MQNVIVIVGPTASGKTSLSIELAKHYNGEIISADSMQIYKYMDIGTAKPTTEEMQGIKHYLIDEVNPDEDFNVVKYTQLANHYIEEILKKGKQPIIVGGTGLYVSSLVNNITFSETECDPELRNKLQQEAEEYGAQYLHEKLSSVDPEAAESIHPNNIKRVIRALEVFYQTQKPKAFHNEQSKQMPPKYNYILLGLNMDRELLYSRINKRVDIMQEAGLLQEVKHIIEMGYGDCNIAMQGIGYKQIISYLNGEISFEEAIELIKRDSRRYAKRQLTWFRRMDEINWLNVDKIGNNDNVVSTAIAIIDGQLR